MAKKAAAAAGVPAWRILDRDSLAAVLGVHPDTVTEYARTGMPCVTRGGGGKRAAYDVVECCAWHRRSLGKNKADEAKSRALNASAELNELKLAESKARLISREQVIAEGRAYTRAWSTKVRGLARRLVQAEVIPRELEKAVAAECDDVLRDIAGWSTLAAVERAARG